MEFVNIEFGSSSCRVHLFGATITSWKVEDEDIIFVSPKAVFDGKKAIRGGVPICFPSFGPWQYGAQHGFARSSNWEVVSPPTRGEEEASATLRLTDTEETRKIWNFNFVFDLKIVLKAKQLALELSVTNTGETDLSFTTALHTYFRVEHVERAKVNGLHGLEYIDKTLPDQPTQAETRQQVTLAGWTDRVYLGPCTGPVAVDGIGAGKSSVVLTSKNLPDFVVWNPWKEKASTMSDLGEEAWPSFVCVEAGQCVRPVTVRPSEQWTASHNMAYETA